MNERMRNHIEKLFEDAPKSRKAFELREELLANSQERYQDLLATGVSEDDAFRHVISSIGNVKELFQGLNDPIVVDKTELEGKIQKIAILRTVAVGLYIFSVFVFLVCNMSDMYSSLDLSLVGFAAMIFISIIPTCMLVYAANIYPKYRKTEDTIVEEFKEWKSESKKAKSVKGAVSCIIWTATLLLYFAVSFATFAWYVTWIIFVAAACVQAIAELIFRLKEIK